MTVAGAILLPLLLGLIGRGLYNFFKDAVADADYRGKFQRLLEDRAWAATYRRAVGGALDAVDTALTPRIGPSEAARVAAGKASWGWPIFDFSLRLALLYPIVGLFLAWGVLGTDGMLGDGFVVLPATDDRWLRYATLAGLCVFGWLIYRTGLAATRRRPTYTTGYMGLGLIGVVAVAAMAGIVAGGIAHAIVFATAGGIIFLAVAVASFAVLSGPT